MPKKSTKIPVPPRNQQNLQLTASQLLVFAPMAFPLTLGVSKCDVQMVKDMEVTPNTYCPPPTGNLQVQEDKGKFMH